MKIKTIKRIILSAFLFFSFLAFSKSALAANYYVDCSASTNGNGAYESPWNNLPSVNAKTFATGDDIYFKVGTTCYLNADSDRLQVDWSGTGSNRVIIGAYHGNGLFGLGGFERPIINGRQLYPTDYQAGIQVVSRSYVTIKDLRFENMGHSAAKSPKSVRVTTSSYVNVENCYFYQSSYGSLEYGRVNAGQILNNTFEQAGHPNYPTSGATIEVTGGNVTDATKNILVRGNVLFNSGNEGIGLYKKVKDSIVEHNTVRDTRSYSIYQDAGVNNTFRYNVVYDSNDPLTSSKIPSRRRCIAVDNEGFLSYVHSSDTKIYGNFVAGCGVGISLLCQKGREAGWEAYNCHSGTKVYNNTLVDNDINFRFSGLKVADTAEVKNNISWLLTAGLVHSSVSYGGTTWSPLGVTFSHNLFRGNALPTLGSNAATNMITGDPKLSKTSGWRNIAPDALSANHFKLLSGSAAIDKGVALVSPYNVDYFKTSRPQGSAWDIGAHEFTSGTTTISGDLNGDGKVDIFDYTIFIGDFGKTGNNLVSDLNKDGKVDIFDYTIFSQNFGKTQ
jgi:hypothetical protein